jgi:hypothetical protein
MAFATEEDGRMETVCSECGNKPGLISAARGRCAECGGQLKKQPLKANKEPVADVLCRENLAVAVGALRDIENWPHGIEGHDTSEEAAHGMNARASKALSELA